MYTLIEELENDLNQLFSANKNIKDFQRDLPFKYKDTKIEEKKVTVQFIVKNKPRREYELSVSSEVLEEETIFNHAAVKLSLSKDRLPYYFSALFSENAEIKLFVQKVIISSINYWKSLYKEKGKGLIVYTTSLSSMDYVRSSFLGSPAKFSEIQQHVAFLFRQYISYCKHWETSAVVISFPTNELILKIKKAKKIGMFLHNFSLKNPNFMFLLDNELSNMFEWYFKKQEGNESRVGSGKLAHYAGRTLNFVLLDNMEELLIECKDREDVIISFELGNQGLLNVLEIIKEENKLSNLLNPPMKNFTWLIRKQLGFMHFPKCKPTHIEGIYLKLEDKLGGWEEVEKLSGSMIHAWSNTLVTNEQYTELYNWGEANKYFYVNRFKYLEEYYFFVFYRISGKPINFKLFIDKKEKLEVVDNLYICIKQSEIVN